MLSFTKGKDIAVVYKKDGRKKPKIIKTIKISPLDFSKNDEEITTEFKVKDIKNDFMMPLPRNISERIYISAPSGSGKSTFIGLYLKEIRKMYKDRPIYFFQE
jgi:hypothetical protein